MLECSTILIGRLGVRTTKKICARFDGSFYSIFTQCGCMKKQIFGFHFSKCAVILIIFASRSCY